MINGNILRTDEKAVFALREIYEKHGYTRFKMSKFEEYDLYVRNKDFLVSDRMISFTDRSGRLLALKPDVTLSIIKNTPDAEGIRKVYYNENVYRASKGDMSEITQTGLECIGKIGFYNICEVIALAAKSLEAISEEYVLDISHLGFVSGLIKSAGLTAFQAEILCALGEKNTSAVKALCEKEDAQARYTDALIQLASTCGFIDEVTASLYPLCETEEMKTALDELTLAGEALKSCGTYDRARVDFSVVNDMSYYNGIVFHGFIKGIPSGVLSGGQYDRLVKKLGKQGAGIGFAVYLDELESLSAQREPFDVDVLLVYNQKDNPSDIIRLSEVITRGGESVLAVSDMSDAIRYKRLVRTEDMK